MVAYKKNNVKNTDRKRQKTVYIMTYVYEFFLRQQQPPEVCLIISVYAYENVTI